MSSDTAITATAAVNLIIRTGINAGTENLTLAAGGVINFSTRAITLAGADIMLTAAATPTASNQDLTITATGALVINTRLNAGSGTLALTGSTLQFWLNDRQQYHS